MAAPITPPSIVIHDPVVSPAAEPPLAALPRPRTPTIDTTAPTVVPSTNGHAHSKTLINRPNSAMTTSESEAHCYLCDEENPGDFSPTTKFLDTCLLCSRYFCPVHKAFQFDQVCNINHSTYYHEMLMQARGVLASQNQAVSAGGTTVGGRDLAEVLIAEGIYPSLGEREKAIFTTSPVDDRKRRELESFRSMEAAMVNGGGRGKKGFVEEMDWVGADVAV